MKQFLKVAAMAACLMLSSCAKAPEQKAEALIGEYMQSHLKDPASYECIEQSNLGKVTPMGRAVPMIMNECSKRHWSDSTDVFIARFKQQLIDTGKDPYEHMGWTMTVRYRAKNSFGGFAINESEFIFDPELTKITEVLEVE